MYLWNSTINECPCLCLEFLHIHTHTHNFSMFKNFVKYIKSLPVLENAKGIRNLAMSNIKSFLTAPSSIQFLDAQKCYLMVKSV